MRYCKVGTCLCVEYKAADIRRDANKCQCEHWLREHHLEGAIVDDDSEGLTKLTGGIYADPPRAVDYTSE